MRVAPITYAQEFVYRVMTLLGPRARLLQLPLAVHITGPIDVERFARAAAELVARNPVLRARLDTVDGDVVQRSSEQKALFDVIELPGATGRQADALLSARTAEPLDLFQENPLRIVLLVTGPGDAYLLFVGHHMFIDATGLQLALHEYLDLYSRSSAGEGGVAGAAELRGGKDGDDKHDKHDKDYFDYAIQEARMIQDGSFAKMIDYWIDKLAGADPDVRLAGRRADPRVQSTGSIGLAVGPDTLAAVTARARRLQVSPFALVVCAIFDALRACTRQDDLLLSVVTDTRRPPFMRTMGTFARTFPVRQSKRNSGMGDAAVKSIFEDIIAAQRNNVPISHFSHQIDWLMARREKGYAMNDVYINYMPKFDAAGSAPKIGANEVSLFTLTAAVPPADIPYEGVALGFTLTQGSDSLSGFLQYEQAIMKEDLACAIRSAWIAALNG